MGVSLRQKRKGGPWWVFIRHQGRRKSKLVGDKNAAKKLKGELELALAAGDFGLTDDEPTEPEEVLTFGDYADQCIDRWEPDPNDPTHGLKKSTHVDYKGCVRNRIKPKLGEIPLASMTRRHVKDFEAALRAEELSTVNIRKHLRILSSILSEAVEEELLQSNPVLDLRKRRRSKAKTATGRKIDPLSREELQKLLRTAEAHTIERGKEIVYPFRDHYPFLLLLARTGMRLGEAVALKWGDVDWNGRFVRVERAYVKDEISTPKSGKARRADLSTQLYNALRTLYRDRFERVVALDPEKQAELEKEAGAEALEAWIFPGANDAPMDVSNFRKRVFKPLLKAAELRHVRIHDLRHTYASLLLQDGVELKYIQEQLGHHSPALTLSVYAHLLPADRHGYVNALDDAAPAGTPMAPSPTPDQESEARVEDAETTKPLAEQGVSKARPA